MRIIFFGSDDFAQENLRRLLEEKFSVVACVTQPDRPSGRGLRVVASLIKESAQKNKIPVLQPENLKDPHFLAQLKRYDADLFIVIAYGKILPTAVLKIPKIFCVNVHGSLLPKYRGAAPINWAIINGDKETGFSLIKMSLRMDAGDIVVQEKMLIGDEETAQSLRERMAKASAECLCRTLKHIAVGRFSLVPQDESKVSLAPKLSKELGRVNWQKSAREIHNLVRGLLPWPAGYASVNGKIFKILQTSVVEQTVLQVPGRILEITQQGICIAAGKGAVLVKHVHPDSGKPMPAHAFAVGQRLSVGGHLG